MTTTVRESITLHDIEATALIFAWGNDRQLVVPATPVRDSLTLWKLYGNDATEAYGFYEESEGPFFAFWIEDCFDPPVYVVRARTFETAYETFCDEFSRLITIDDSDLPDYITCSECGANIGADQISEYQPTETPCTDAHCTGHYDDHITYNASGVAIDTDNVQGRQIQLLRIIAAEQPEGN